jgi:hypothetical protein
VLQRRRNAPTELQGPVHDLETFFLGGVPAEVQSTVAGAGERARYILRRNHGLISVLSPKYVHVSPLRGFLIMLTPEKTLANGVVIARCKTADGGAVPGYSRLLEAAGVECISRDIFFHVIGQEKYSASQLCRVSSCATLFYSVLHDLCV